MRLIDEEYLIEHVCACMENDRLMKTATKDEILRMIEDIPSAQPEQRWIPCSERLPEDSNFYIVTRKDFLVGFIWYSVFHGWEWDGQNNIIAWMTLPEPYEGGDHA